MDMYKDILIKYILNTMDDLDAFVEGLCYKTLMKIKVILEDDRLDDRDCFMKIEEIVCTFEELGIGIEYRHDFS